ncbi:MAG: S41 family peptidase [Clostridia bacterium]|nr:S41 family peptidase [Clostridia bacterium]
MKRKYSILLTVFLCLLCIAVTFQCTYTVMQRKVRQAEAKTAAPEWIDDVFLTPELLGKMKNIAEVYRTYYVDAIDAEYFSDMIMRGFVAGTEDQFGQYLTADESEDYFSEREGEFAGIGISVLYNADYAALETLSVYTDSPAEAAGMLPGDLIVAVGEESVASLGYYGAIARMRGEVGTTVSFTVYRPDTDREIAFSIVRQTVEEVTVNWHFYDDSAHKMAVVRILSFNAKTPAQFREAIEAAKSGGAEGFLFDLRSNPGGNLDAICEILDLLLPAGPIIRLDYKGKENDRQIDSDASCLDMPMTVLVDGSTASAAELFSSALQDYKLAKVVGTQTYGKGTMQSIVTLPDGSVVSLTVAYYLPPFSANYHGKGVTPDVISEQPEEERKVNLNKLTDATDSQLRDAARVLREAIETR